MDKQQIEQLLAHSTRNAQKLTPAEKDVLFRRVVDRAAKKPAWWSQLMWPTVVFSAGLAAVLIGIVLWSDQTEIDTQFIAYRTQHNQNANTNTNSVTNVNQSEDPQIAFGPRFHRSSIEQYIYGIGGAPDVHDWTIETTLTLGQDTKTVKEQFVYRLSEERMRQLADGFGNFVALYNIVAYDGTTGLSTLDESADTRVCIEYDFTQVLNERCVYVNNRGAVNMDQPTAVAQANGTAEALAYIAELTGISVSEWTVVEVPTETSVEAIEQWKQYQAYPKDTAVGSLTYMTPGWHFATEGGKLVSLSGSVLAIQDDPAAKTYTTISAQEAYERMQSDFALDPATQDIARVTSTVGYYENPLSSGYATRQGISITAQEVTLEYELFENRKDRESGKHTLRLLPVYRIRGVETGTNITFEVLIDATQDHTIANQYRLIDHPAQLF